MLFHCSDRSGNVSQKSIGCIGQNCMLRVIALTKEGRDVLSRVGRRAVVKPRRVFVIISYIIHQDCNKIGNVLFCFIFYELLIGTNEPGST